MRVQRYVTGITRQWYHLEQGLVWKEVLLRLMYVSRAHGCMDMHSLLLSEIVNTLFVQITHTPANIQFESFLSQTLTTPE